MTFGRRGEEEGDRDRGEGEDVVKLDRRLISFCKSLLGSGSTSR
jgi:hypothetical protein